MTLRKIYVVNIVESIIKYKLKQIIIGKKTEICCTCVKNVVTFIWCGYCKFLVFRT